MIGVDDLVLLQDACIKIVLSMLRPRVSVDGKRLSIDIDCNTTNTSG